METDGVGKKKGSAGGGVEQSRTKEYRISPTFR